MTIRIRVAIGAGLGCLLLGAAEPKDESVQVSKTERVAFPPGGTLRLRKSAGVVIVEGWDQPDVEITTIKSTTLAYGTREAPSAPPEFDRVKVSTERHGDVLDIVTSSPRHRNFDLEYQIKAPRTARLIAQHGSGDVTVDNLTGDIDATLHVGQITLHLPEEGRYSIDAKSDFGDINSDFPGDEKRRFWFLGHRMENGGSAAAHKLKLRVLYGDVVILKIRTPKEPESPTPTPRPSGQ